MFAVRITRDFEQLKPFFQKFSDTPSSVCVVFQHDADEEISRTHVHALLSANVSTDTLKRWVQAVIGPVVRYDWAWTTCREPDRYVTYMSKGKLEPSFLHGMDYEKVAALRAEWKEPLSKDSPKEKREDVTSYSMAEELAKWIDENKLRTKCVQDRSIRGMIMSKMIHDAIQETEIVEQCIKIHNKYRKGYCDFSLVRVIQTAYGMCSDETCKQRLIGKVLEKLSPRIV